MRRVTAEFGVTPRTLRYYEELGLVAPTKVGLERFYSPSDRHKIRLILTLRRAGIALADIPRYLVERDGKHCIAISKSEIINHLQKQEAVKLDLLQSIELLERWFDQIQINQQLT